MLSLPVSTTILGCDNPEQVVRNAQTAKAFSALSRAEMTVLEDRVERVARKLSGFKKRV